MLRNVALDGQMLVETGDLLLHGSSTAKAAVFL
jgi:hypothetical protein